MKKFIGIIPARFESTRLPGKALLDTCGKPMIQHVYERAKEALDDVYVATDDDRIFAAVESFGGKAIMTPADCFTGTDRCYHAYEKIKKKIVLCYDDVIINIQGDQPLLHNDHIYKLMAGFIVPAVNELPEVVTVAFKQDEICCLFKEHYLDRAFVVMDKNQNALYFSRYTLPYCIVRNERFLYQHIGIYGYTVKALIAFYNMNQTSLELAESLEQNRWLENGQKIRVVISNYASMSVDTQDDLDKVRAIMENGNKMKGL